MNRSQSQFASRVGETSPVPHTDRVRSMLLVAVVALATAAPTASHAASASFQGLGFLSGETGSYAYGVNGDGSVVVGNGSQAFRWTAAGGMVGLGAGQSSYAYGVNGDGSVAVGYYSGDTFNFRQAFRWTAAGGMVGLGYISSGYNHSFARGVNGDGSVVVGYSDSSTSQAFRWTAAGGMVGLGYLPGKTYSYAEGVNGDGSVVVGYSQIYSIRDTNEAFRWTAAGGMVGLGFLPGYNESVARGVNGDGSVVVGYSSPNGNSVQAIRWTAAGGMVGLGWLSGKIFSYAYAVNGDGSVVVGYSSGGLAAEPKAFRWTAAGGMQSIKDLLTAAGVNVTGWSLQYATAVSNDGATIVGYGLDPSNKIQAWRAYIPLPPPGVLAVGSVVPLNVYGSVGGPFASDMSGQFTLTNTGSTSLDYSISPPNWLAVSPSSSGSLAGGASTNVMVSPGPSTMGMSAGNYSSTIAFMNTTNGSGNTSVVTNLLINQPPGRSLDPNDNGRSNPPPDFVGGVNRLGGNLPPPGLGSP